MVNASLSSPPHRILCFLFLGHFCFPRRFLSGNLSSPLWDGLFLELNKFMEQCPQLRNRSLAWVRIKNANRTRNFRLGKTFLPSILNTIQTLIFQGEFFVTRLVRSLPQEYTGWPQIPLLKHRSLTFYYSMLGLPDNGPPSPS